MDDTERSLLAKMRRRADNRRNEIVAEIDSKRPKLKKEKHHTPGGTVEKDVHTPETDRQNAEVTAKVTAYKKRIDGMRQDAGARSVKAFNVARKGERDR